MFSIGIGHATAFFRQNTLTPGASLRRRRPPRQVYRTRKSGEPSLRRRDLLRIGIIWNPVGESTDICTIDP